MNGDLMTTPANNKAYETQTTASDQLGSDWQARCGVEGGPNQTEAPLPDSGSQLRERRDPTLAGPPELQHEHAKTGKWESQPSSRIVLFYGMGN